MSERKIQKDIKLANDLSDDVADIICKTKLAYKPKELRRLAKHDSEMQLKLAQVILRRAANDARGAEVIVGHPKRSGVNESVELYKTLQKIRLELSKANQERC